MLHAKFQDLRTFGSEKKVFKGFTIYGRGGNIGHVTQVHLTNMCPSKRGCTTYNLAGLGQAGLENKRFEKTMVIYMYIANEAGADDPVGLSVCTIIDIVTLWSFTVNLCHFLKDFLAVFPIKSHSR